MLGKSRLLAPLALAVLAPLALGQEGAALLDAPLVVSDKARLRLVLDLDGDGFADAVSWEWENSYADRLLLTGWINDGAGRLVPTWTYALNGNWTTGTRVSMGRCEIDGNALEDFWVLLGGSSSGSYMPFQSNGRTVATNLSYPYGWSDTLTGIVGGALHDWNDDGVLERALLMSNGWLRTWVIGQSSQTVCSSLQLGAGWTDLLTVDGNGDALPDLLLVRGSELRLIEMQGCQFGQQTTWFTGLPGTPMPAVGDIDGDGDEDIVVFDMQGYVVVRRTARNAWQPEPYRAGGIGTDLADVDGDGDLDALCCGGGGGGGPGPWYNDILSTFRVSLNDGTGVFAPAIEIPGLGADHLAGAADLDQDGDVDLVAGRCIYYAPEPIVSERMPLVGSGAQAPRSTADFDRDGDTDLECGASSVMENRGDGVFAARAPWGAQAPRGMLFRGPGFPGDFDGDGDLDLVVAMHDATGGAFVSMRLLANNGGGGLVDAGDAGAPGVDFNVAAQGANTPEASVAVDVDADGDVDLVTRTVTGTIPRSQIWLNDGGGSFVQGQAFLGLRFESAVDLNGDGLLDAVLADSRVRIHWGLGNGVFTSAGFVQLGLVIEPHIDRYVVRDLDGDGDVDIAGVSRGYLSSGSAGVLFANSGLGSFQELLLAQPLDDRASFPKTALAEDLNGDGHVDLLFGPVARARSAAAIVLRRADGTAWTPAFQQVVWANDGAEPVMHAGLLADVDGDGDADLVTDRRIANRLFEGPDAGSHCELGRSLHVPGEMPSNWGGRGPFRPGENAELRLTGAPPGLPGIFTAGYRLSPFDVPTAGVEPFLITHRFAIVTSGAPNDPPGTGSWTLAYVVPGYKAGRTYRYQVELFDPSGESPYARPNGLVVHYGR